MSFSLALLALMPRAAVLPTTRVAFVVPSLEAPFALVGLPEATEAYGGRGPRARVPPPFAVLALPALVVVAAARARANKIAPQVVCARGAAVTPARLPEPPRTPKSFLHELRAFEAQVERELRLVNAAA
jgi:hypothetical protein